MVVLVYVSLEENGSCSTVVSPGSCFMVAVRAPVQDLLIVIPIQFYPFGKQIENGSNASNFNQNSVPCVAFRSWN